MKDYAKRLAALEQRHDDSIVIAWRHADGRLYDADDLHADARPIAEAVLAAAGTVVVVEYASVNHSDKNAV